LLSAIAPQSLISLSAVRVYPIDPVAISIEQGIIRGVANWVDATVCVVAIFATPRGTSESLHVRKVVIINIVYWEMVVSKSLYDVTDRLEDCNVAEFGEMEEKM
jgi:non-canonical (house-cleaning) NTP pyrophosphatase